MTFTTPRKPRRQEQGIALVVVLLFTTIVLTIVVTTTANLALSARGGGASERGAYQALLVAEAGQNLFNMRVKAMTPAQKYYKNTNSAADLNAWLTTRGLTSLSVAGGTATLAFEAASTSGGNATLVITGVTPAGAKKIVAQDYQSITPPSLGTPVWAPLLSYSNVTATGSAQITGESGSTATGTVQVATLPSGASIPASTTTSTFNVTVASSPIPGGKLLLGVGDYIQFSPNPAITSYEPLSPYKVIAVNGTQVTVRTLKPTSATTITGGTVMRIDSAVTHPTTQTSGQLKVSDTSMYRVGSNVFVSSALVTGSTSVQGKITVIDSILKTLTVQWTTSTASTIAEGTPVRIDVGGAISAYEVETSGGALISSGFTQFDSTVQTKNPFNSTSNPDLFTYTFGLTKTEMASLINSGAISAIQIDGNSFSGTVSDFTYVTGDTKNNINLCGSGLLIVTGSLTNNNNSKCNFSGLVYVMGDYNQQGNSSVTGSIIVEGKQTSNTECVATILTTGKQSGQSNGCDTKIAGNSNSDPAKIIFDRAALLRATSLIPDPIFQVVPGTWRQR